MDFKEKRHVSLDKSKIECYNCHRKGHFARECRSRRSQGRRPYGDNGRSNAQITKSPSQALVAQDGLGGYDWSNDCHLLFKLIKFTKSNEYHAVPPPITGNPLTPRADISFAGLDEYAFRNKNHIVSKSKINRDDVIIKDWTLDDEDDECANKTVSSVKPNVTQAVRILTRASLVNTVRSNVSTVRSISIVRPLYTGRPVSTARPLASKIAQSNSVIRPKHPRLDIVRPKASNTPIKRAVVSKGKVENVFKKDKWVWRPKMNYQDHVYKYNGSYMLKKFEYGNLEILLQDHAVVDSGCSSHITGNKAYLSDYEDLNEGFVAFGNELKAPRKDGVYSLDLKNIVHSEAFLRSSAKLNLSSSSNLLPSCALVKKNMISEFAEALTPL
ncbi:ribonuclease H-like domain-containing protein [Tanacetum coccineum]